jgi:hypothetical protein
LDVSAARLPPEPRRSAIEQVFILLLVVLVGLFREGSTGQYRQGPALLPEANDLFDNSMDAFAIHPVVQMAFGCIPRAYTNVLRGARLLC